MASTQRRLKELLRASRRSQAIYTMTETLDIRFYRIMLILGCVAVYAISIGKAQQPATAYIVKRGEGPVLQRAPGNTIAITVDPARGSNAMAMGTQSLEPGAGIPVHRHEREDEVLFIHDGRGTAIVGDERTAVAKGDTIFIPRGAWHGIETNADRIDILWTVTPPGLEHFFREASTASGEQLKNLTPAQMQAIGLKHGVTFRPR